MKSVENKVNNIYYISNSLSKMKLNSQQQSKILVGTIIQTEIILNHIKSIFQFWDLNSIYGHVNNEKYWNE